MPHKTKKLRREYYQKNKDKINTKRREYSKRPEVKAMIKERQTRWRTENRELANERSRISKKKYEAKAKKLVFEHYGKKCACCGEDNIIFLTIDHINGGGTEHRRKDGRKICVWLFRNNFPKGFQTLCFNCNWGRYLNKGICPHKDL